MYSTLLAILSCYIISLPTAIFTCFYLNYGIKGLWIGLILNTFVQSIGFFLIAKCSNMDDIVKESYAKILKEK
jgi:Na+-driven multidrug efflux pump